MYSKPLIQLAGFTLSSQTAHWMTKTASSIMADKRTHKISHTCQWHTSQQYQSVTASAMAFFSNRSTPPDQLLSSSIIKSKRIFIKSRLRRNPCRRYICLYQFLYLVPISIPKQMLNVLLLFPVSYLYQFFSIVPVRHQKKSFWRDGTSYQYDRFNFATFLKQPVTVDQDCH